MHGGVKWWAISHHQACKQGEIRVTTKHARRVEMVGHLPHQACKQGEFGVTTKHARRVLLVGHFALPSMQVRRVWGDNQACKES